MTPIVALPRPHRHGEHVPRLEPGLLVDPAVEARVVAGIVDDRGLAVRDDPAGDALPGRNALAASTCSPGSPVATSSQLAGLLVEQEQSELVSASSSSVADAMISPSSSSRLERRVQQAGDLE